MPGEPITFGVFDFEIMFSTSKFLNFKVSLILRKAMFSELDEGGNPEPLEQNF